MSIKELRLPTKRTGVARIIRTFAAATPEERADGRDWYGQARILAEELAADWAPETGADDDAVKRAAAVIAVLSPRLAWSKNVELAQLAYAQYYGSGLTKELYFVEGWPGLKGNARKAFRILDGEEPEDVVSGEKVTPFFWTIYDPSDPRAVVVDRHALDVVMGRVLTDAERGLLLGRKNAYAEVHEMYRKAAADLSDHPDSEDDFWTPAAVQAACWVSWRRTRAANAKANRKTETARPTGPWSWDGAPQQTEGK